MARILETITTKQQRINEQQTRQQASQPIRIYRTPIRRRTTATRPDLPGASVWTGDLLSRTWRDRLLGAAAGAALTLATLWLILVSAATATVILRAEPQYPAPANIAPVAIFLRTWSQAAQDFPPLVSLLSACLPRFTLCYVYCLPRCA